MELDKALKVYFDSTKNLRTRQGINSPVFMSKEMMRLSQATGAIEEHLAKLEQDYEIQVAQKLKVYLIDEGTSATNAEKRVKIDLGELKGQLAYLSRLVSSAWKQISTIQSRHNHLLKENTHQV
jgi:hypothetical protein